MPHEKSTAPVAGMDVVIVSTNTPSQESAWQKRLKALKGTILKADAFVIAVHEDWPGGAGNGLGTLFAYHKAHEKARFMYRTDLYDLQKKGASVAIYHAAGAGKSLFPLAASELSDLSAIKLPGSPLLEAVLAQTGRFAEGREGRLSVFWGDQIFLPHRRYTETPDHHIEIMCRLADFPTEGDWAMQRRSHYGSVGFNRYGETKLFEKISYPQLLKLASTKSITAEDRLGTSLGSFSLSPQMTFALLREFQPELENRRGRLDSDAHFWMPLTLDLPDYLKLMPDKSAAQKHYNRMDAFRTKFFRLHPKKQLFRCVDIGTQCHWWDYGSVPAYYQNLIKVSSPCLEGQAMRLFYQVDPAAPFHCGNRLIADEASCLIDCQIRSGKVTNSLLVGVHADSIEAKDCVIINSNFASLQASRSLLYNVSESKQVRFSPGTVRSDVVLPMSKKKLTLYSHQGRDGREDWNVRLPQNPMSYEEAYRLILSEL